MRIKKTNLLFLLAIFLLPWQTQYIHHIIPMAEGVSEYGKLAFFVTELLIAVAFVFSRRSSEQPPKELQRTVRGFYLFLATGFLSLTFAHFYVISLYTLGHLLIAGMLFVYLIDPKTRLDRVLIAYVLGLIVPCVLGWYQYLHGFSPASTLFGLAEKQVDTSGVAVVATQAFRSLRAYGSFPHPNIFGGYLAIAIVILGWLVRSAETKWRSWAYAPLIVLFTSTLILTFSRSAWLALSVSLTVILVQAFWYKRLIPHRAIPFITLGFVTILLSTLILHTHVFARFDSSLHVEAISLEERASQYATFPSVFRLNPLFGVGDGAYTFALEAMNQNQPAWSYQPIHNAILLLLAELGLVGLVAFGYWMFELIKVIWSHRTQMGGIFAVAILTELCFLATFDHYLFSLWAGLVLAAFSLAVCVRWAMLSK